ncbi:glycosyltransferase family 4 protein [Saccharibacillus sp. CPCC 101409]|uniref:glycosyltransferase family 4 protein n=1 Tax=Saccharibacillus sp. CPCC 101409 TaxID=3058041 RepID=UPI0026721A1F|nr:glycosyltransferase family 4 protein [Saccharibacillus sp. CPCC 101409]MDO3412025.1 glycosyltransferase family 4 protein [Saccharibacillus sp. CPCC 101409]
MKHSGKPRAVLTLVQYYLPGYKAGGPITTVSNVVSVLGGEYRFKIVTSDRDLGDSTPYNLPLGTWNEGVANTLYLKKLSSKKFWTIMRETSYDVLYINSFFSYSFSIRPLILHILRCSRSGKRVVVAPRGEFTSGALSVKASKKKMYLAVARFLGFYRFVVWQASSTQEASEIRRIFGSKAEIVIAPDLASTVHFPDIFPFRDKSAGCLNILFLSRISPMKNLKFALNSLRGINARITFRIRGPIEDSNYWLECKRLIDSLPSNITAVYGGEIPHCEIGEELQRAHLFYLPTLGEGFGHAIFEAMQYGCPVLVSDRTPWNDIEERHAGFVRRLQYPNEFVDALKNAAEMDFEEFERLSRSAFQYTREYQRYSRAEEGYRILFD